MSDIIQENNEFIATLTADGIVFADTLGQSLGDLLQEAVAYRVSQRIIDMFEPVQIRET